VAADIASGAVINVRPGVFQPDDIAAVAGEVVDKSGDIEIEAAKRKFLEVVEAEVGDVDITKSDVLVSVGRGIEDEDNLEIAFDLAKAIKELKAGKVEFKVDKAGVVHAPLGKVSFGPEKILDNLKALIDTLQKAKPASAKGTYFRGMAVSTTMGPGVKIDTNSIRSLME
jgi:hypothetical protein